MEPAEKTLSPAGSSAARLLPTLLMGAAFVVPMVFSVAIDDTFGLPKLIALWSILGVAVVLAALVRGDRRLRIVGNIDAPVALFAAMHLVALAASVDREQSFWGERLQHQGVLTLILYLGFFYLARIALGGGVRLLLFYRAVAIGGAAVAAYGVLQRMGLDPIWSELPNGRIFSSIGQPNALGAYLAFVLPLAAVVASPARSRRGQFAGWATVGLVAVALLLTLSRSALIGLAIGLLIIGPAVAKHRGLTARRAAVSVGALAAAALVTVAVVGPARDTAESIVRRVAASAEFGVPGSVRMHLDLWTVAAEITSDHPIVGTGPDTFAVVFPEYRDRVLAPPRAAVFVPFRVESPHNVYLAIASGAGVIALGAYLWLFGALATMVLRSAGGGDPVQRLLLIGGLAAVAAHGATDLFITADLTGTWLFWMLSGGLVATAAHHT